MKKFAAALVAVILLFNSFTLEVFADTSASGIDVPKKIMLYLKPDLTVELNGSRQIFKDVNGQAVYPIIYKGTTYLPVRAVSALMKEPIQWDNGSKTVFIGKTLEYPIKDKAPIPTGAISADEGNGELSGLAPSLVAGHLKPDVLVMYDFVIQSFQNVNGNVVYPIIYNGSTYLPVRAISNLMNQPITWDGTAKKICIGNGEKDKTQGPEEQKPLKEVSAAFTLLKNIYEREEILYYEATAKITSIKNTTSTDEKQIIASSASENYVIAQSLTVEIKAIDQTDFTKEEREACEKLTAFAESTEYYILVLENIAYLAAQDSDYSMLAETFLYFAMQSQANMEEARQFFVK